MKKRGRTATKKQPATKTTPNLCSESPNSFQMKSNSTKAVGTRRKPTPSPMKLSVRRTESLSSISEVRELASSQLDSLKRQVDRFHSDILKDLDSSHSRLLKRFKMQSQACQQLGDETEKEFKKMSERIAESCEAMKVSYAEFILEAQTNASRVCKTSIPQKAQSLEKSIDAIRNRFGF